MRVATTIEEVDVQPPAVTDKLNVPVVDEVKLWLDDVPAPVQE